MVEVTGSIPAAPAVLQAIGAARAVAGWAGARAVNGGFAAVIHQTIGAAGAVAARA